MKAMVSSNAILVLEVGFRLGLELDPDLDLPFRVLVVRVNNLRNNLR